MPERTAPGTATAAQYLSLLQQLLPPGKAFRLRGDSLAGKFALGLTRELVRLHDFAVDLIEEMDPSTATDALAAWERSLGLPEAGDEIAATTAQRRLDAAAKLATSNTRTEADWIALAEAAGYTSVTITQASDTMATCESYCDAAIGDAYYYAYSFTIHMPGGTPSPAFEALCRKIVQAGVQVLFDYT
jgi:uncharacterized protein YmfQ (DUF2313 family)